MRATAVAADRAYEIRAAARSWQRAGAIDEATLAAIEAAHPDDRRRARPAFRVLYFVFTWVAVVAAFGIADVAGAHYGQACLTFGVLLTLLTEILIGPLRRDRGGTEEATAFLAVLFLLAAAAWLSFYEANVGWRNEISLLLAVGTVILSAAAWRWGYSLFAAGGACCLIFLLARFDHGRLLWIVAGTSGAVALLRGAYAARVAPSHRRACKWALVIAVLAVYAAVSIYSLDHRLVELWGDRTLPPLAWKPLRALCAALTAAMPVALLFLAIRSRRRLLVDLGVLLAFASLATVREYVQLAALWLAVAAAGGGLIALALLLRRRLDQAPGRELGGFTAEPLFESASRRRTLEIAAAVATLSPEARTTPEEPEFRGQGGASGGAGATGEF